MSFSIPTSEEPLRLGSGIEGASLSYVSCARSRSGKRLKGPCPNVGLYQCPECRLVTYCSEECQLEHGKFHKKQCKNPYGSKNWQPAWTLEKRAPAFLSPNPAPYVSFGREGHYLWGNVPATDYLNLAFNEGANQVHKDFNLCFSASGDIRNMVKTVNGLPENYQAKVTIIMNDFNPYVSIRNLILVCMLCDKLPPDVEELAEAAVHYSYSAALTAHQAQYLSYWMNNIVQCAQPSSATDSAFGGPIADNLTHLSFMFPNPTMEIFKQLLNAKYSLEGALVDMRKVRFAPSRVDYRDRHLGALRPPHRVSYIRHSETGMVLPFGQNPADFTEPNRILFDQDGKWLLRDASSPLAGHDMIDAVAGGRKRRVPHGDLFGALFFHIKDQFAEFARRARRFKMEVVFHSMDMQLLAGLLASAVSPTPDLPIQIRSLCGSSTSIPLIPPLHFDRIDTSNVMDSIGIEAVLHSWAPLLNSENKHAALLIYSMNWVGKIPDARPETSGPDVFVPALEMIIDYEAEDPGEWNRFKEITNAELYMLILAMKSAAFHDNGPAFDEFLQHEGVPKVCASLKINMRSTNRIHSKRLGIPLWNQKQKFPNLTHEDFYNLTSVQGANTSERFLEFGLQRNQREDRGVVLWMSGICAILIWWFWK